MLQLPRKIIVIVALSVALALILLFDLLPILRGGEIFNWQWTYEVAPLVRTITLTGTVVVYLLGAWWIVRRRRARWALMWAFAGAVVLALVAVWLRHDDPLQQLFIRTLSPVVTGPHFAAAHIDWQGGEWHDWLAFMESYRDTSIHVALSPPGLPLLYGGLTDALSLAPDFSAMLQRSLLPYQCHNFTVLAYSPPQLASAIFGVLMPLWAALAVIPLYVITRRLTDDRMARYGALAWALVPGISLFAPTFNTLYPLLALGAFWLLLRGYDTAGYRRVIAWIFSGLLTGALTFANFSLVPLAALFGFYALLRGWQARSWQQPLIVGAWFAVGALLPWGIFWLLSGVDPLAMLSTAFDAHLALDRPYLPWLWMHGWEWALFAGIPFVLVWLSGMVRARQPLPDALALTLALLLLSDTARGETARVWIFFTPFLLISAAQILHRERASHRAWISLLIAHAALLIALAATWDVITAPDMTVPPPSPAAHADVTPADARFADAFALRGWSGEVDGAIMTLRLNWQALNTMTTPYYFSALPVAPDGTTPVEAVVWQPDQTRYPTSCWATGDIIGDRVDIRLPANVDADEWYVSLRAFADPDDPFGSTLTVTLPDGTSDQQTGIGPIHTQTIAGS